MKILKDIFLFLLVFSVSMLLLDRFVYYTAAVNVSLYNYDHTIGRTLRPGVPFLFAGEGLNVGEVNEFGFFGKGYTRQKTGKLRIALIGDSYVESFQTLDRQYFGRIMEKLLSEKYGVDAEVLNFGRSGFTMSDMYVYNKNFVNKFDPDIVMFFVSNEDFSRVNKKSGTPYPYMENDSLLIYIYPPESSSSTPRFLSLYNLAKYFPLAQSIRNSINLNQEGQTPNILFGKFYEVFEHDKVNEVNKSFSSDNVLLNIIDELSKSEDNIIVYRDREKIDPVLHSLFLRSGIGYLDIADTLDDVWSDDYNPYYWTAIGKEGHWNLTAHRVIGEYLARKIYEYQNK